MRRSIRLLAVTIVLTCAATACGGRPDPKGSSTGGAASAGGGQAGSQDQRFQEGRLKYARCMREHGVEMPDPKPNEGMPAIAAGDEKTMRADKACAKLMPVNPNAPDDATRQKQMVALAKCMRAHGIPMSDPKPGEGLAMPTGGEKVLKAARECSAKARP